MKDRPPCTTLGQRKKKEWIRIQVRLTTQDLVLRDETKVISSYSNMQVGARLEISYEAPGALYPATVVHATNATELRTIKELGVDACKVGTNMSCHVLS